MQLGLVVLVLTGQLMSDPPCVALDNEAKDEVTFKHEELTRGLQQYQKKMDQMEVNMRQTNAQLYAQQKTLRHQNDVIEKVLAKYPQRKDSEPRSTKCDLGSAPTEFLEMTDTYGSAVPYPLQAGNNSLACMDMCRQMVDCYGVNIEHSGETMECMAVNAKPVLTNSSVWNYYEKLSQDACVVDVSQVAFQANIGEYTCFPTYTTVVYLMVDVNYGGGLMKNGCFVCPVHGLYKFSIRNRVNQGDRAQLFIYLDGVSFGGWDTYAHAADNNAEYTTLFTECDIGQEVCVKTKGTEACLTDDADKLANFSGELLFAL